MSLRVKFLLFFVILGVVPLLVVGAVTYLRSMRAVEALIEDEVGRIAEHAAAELDDRYSLRESDLLLLANNVETQNLYAAYSSGDPAIWNATKAQAESYFSQAWNIFGRWYEWIEFVDSTGAVIYRLGEDREVFSPADPDRISRPELVLMAEKPVRSIAEGNNIGTVVAALHLESFLPLEALETKFGQSGYTVVLDRSADRVLYHPHRSFLYQGAASLLSPEYMDVGVEGLSRTRGGFLYRDEDSHRVASFVSLSEPAWTVIVSGAVSEFAPPFTRTGAINLLLVLVVTAVVFMTFVILSRSATSSLKKLTKAADQVGEGNFEPDLPPPASDEVGKLTAAFNLMVEKVRDSLREIETSRHMAAVGAFASQLSHEIRNPLTSLKLNLQGLRRDVEEGRIPPDAARSVDIGLHQIDRLDRVVHGVLKLGAPRAEKKEPCSVHDVLQVALEAVHAQLERQGVAVEMQCLSPISTVLGNAEQLEAVFLNLFLNAAEAMPEEGELIICTETVGEADRGKSFIRVLVADDGPGIPPQDCERIFDPFYSTKPDGTGFGLPLALQTVEEHGGKLWLNTAPEEARGAEFIVELPLADEVGVDE